MNTAVISLNTDPKLKREAMKTAEEMGLTLSIIINNSLRKFVAERRMEFTIPEIPNTRTIKAIKDARKEYKSGKLKFYTDMKEMRKAMGV
jgi:addiction module RelB/DinJ family antitoxin